MPDGVRGGVGSELRGDVVDFEAASAISRLHGVSHEETCEVLTKKMIEAWMSTVGYEDTALRGQRLVEDIARRSR